MNCIGDGKFPWTTVGHNHCLSSSELRDPARILIIVDLPHMLETRSLVWSDLRWNRCVLQVIVHAGELDARPAFMEFQQRIADKNVTDQGIAAACDKSL
jgi:hypothetical protein